MKKVISVLLCMLLLAGAALAEQTMDTEKVFSGGEGYTIVYPPEYLKAAGRYGYAVAYRADGIAPASIAWSF